MNTTPFRFSKIAPWLTWMRLIGPAGRVSSGGALGGCHFTDVL